MSDEVVRPCRPCRHNGHGSCVTLITGAPCGCLCRLADQDCPDYLPDLGGAA